jgi:hypothetical protein
VQDDAGVWEELDALYASAGGNPISFRRLERGARDALDGLRAYYRELARDYVERLERRLSRPGAKLTDEERALLRAWIGTETFDESRERRLLAELGELRATMDRLRELRAAPLSPEGIEKLAAALEDASSRANAIARALEAKDGVRKLEQELQGDREALLSRIRKLLFESGAAAEERD